MDIKIDAFKQLTPKPQIAKRTCPPQPSHKKAAKNPKDKATP